MLQEKRKALPRALGGARPFATYPQRAWPSCGASAIVPPTRRVRRSGARSPRWSDGLLAGADAAALTAPLDASSGCVRCRLSSPPRRSRFLFLFKQAVGEVVGDERRQAYRARRLALATFTPRLDELTLAAFDIYVGCREGCSRSAPGSATARTYSLLKQAGLLIDTDAAEGPPAAPRAEGRS